MASDRMNVLVYSDSGSTVESVRHCLYSLRSLLSPNYAVSSVSAETIIKEPWRASCALLVFPGGADLGYCRMLNGEGGYYGSSRCEFEVGDKKLEVVGDRELDFFPGICRGSAFSGFVYNSEHGAKAAELEIVKESLNSSVALPESFHSYFNGGSVFVDAEIFEDRGVEILANYKEELSVDPGKGAAAVVYCKIGQGGALLTGPHPEFAGVNLKKDAKGMNPGVVDAIIEDDKPRKEFLKACLIKLGLKINQDEQSVPSLSRIHLSSFQTSNVAKILKSWEGIANLVEGERYIKAEVDMFHIEQRSTIWSMAKLAQTVAESIPGIPSPSDNDQANGKPDSIIDYEKVAKKLVTHDEPPSAKSTPYFNHQAFFSNLTSYNKSNLQKNDSPEPIFGENLLYGEVVTSTNTLLEENPTLMNTLPTGTTFTATTQVSARGRGTNVWISPAGNLMFSIVLRHSLKLNVKAPVVFIQYLVAIAVAEAIQTYNEVDSLPQGLTQSSTEPTKPISPHRRVPVKLKWPNDIYILDPTKCTRPASYNAPSAPYSADNDLDRAAYSKIGGVLVKSSYAGGDYTLVVGVGLNVAANAGPTTSLNAVVDALNRAADLRGTGGPHLPHYTTEKLLARILACMQSLYGVFCAHGFAGRLERLYYRHWLHSGQVVNIETEGDARARIKGVTTDWGLLLAEEVFEAADGREVGNGRKFALQTDSNSFDFFRGLLKRKI